jgi:uncharacterized protein (DUF2126 family)/transglutaminase-like putative cysteine protease
MSIQVAVHHRTHYLYDRPVALGPHEIRLRPAPHCRTPVLSYSLNVVPEKHFVNWQQDVFSNYIARFVFPERATELEITVDLVADMGVINPFDFFVESYAGSYPFAYREGLAKDLAPFLAIEERGPLLVQWIGDLRAGLQECATIDFLVNLNQRLRRDVRYLVRMAPGVQSCEQTLELGSGSCRDSGWLLVQILRHCGLAARFVSGYLVQLVADVKPLDGAPGPERDFTDLHAWAEVYLRGGGGVGLDPTSGLLAGEGHIPLACTPAPASAAPVTGAVDPGETRFDFSMSVTRIHEDPRVTRPYSDSQWAAIDNLGVQIDNELAAGDVRLTQGGEPTFVSIDDSDDPEWNTTALSPKKRELAEQLAWRLHRRFAPDGLFFYGQGKWYPGEPLPRWALGNYWRSDGVPVWCNPQLIAADAAPVDCSFEDARRLAHALADELGVGHARVIPAFEEPLRLLQTESKLPIGVDELLNGALGDAEARARLARALERGFERPAAFVLPLRAHHTEGRPSEKAGWESSPWPLRRERLFLVAGESPVGYRLPIAALPALLPEGLEKATPREVVRTALCVEVRDGHLYVFLPPLERLEDFLGLVGVVERVTGRLACRVRLEGYAPPSDPRLRVLNVTPDPGVIEVNIHPAANWRELCTNVFALDEEARATRLGTEKFMLDGRHIGTGGGNHVTLGGPSSEDSPLLRRPDLLRSLLTYWQHHPALSYLFAGLFIGPTSQAPRVDEARDDNLYELEIAFQQMALSGKSSDESPDPSLIDRLLRNLLVDLTGNTHRAEFCIDKLYSPDSPTGRLGLLEFRAFEMPPHPQMSLTQMLLLRALVARFWKSPYVGGLIRWGTQLHDGFMLPHFVNADMHDVVRDLQRAGYAFELSWFDPFLEFRFPRYGSVVYDNIRLELRQAIEPWNVLGEEVSAGGTARYVDSSVERLQAKVNGLTTSRFAVACNGRALPLHPAGTPGEFVAGVRYRAWDPPSALHPTLGVHTPLVFDIVDNWSGRSIGGCTYHVVHPGGRSYDRRPVNANEAEARRIARFWDHGHTPGPMRVKPEPLNPNFPRTLDLRWSPE